MSRPRRRVFLDPDGTGGRAWLYVVILDATGVVYQTQCGGGRNDLREVEGFLVPLGGSKLDAEAGDVDPAELTGVFHQGRVCLPSASVDGLPPERLAKLREVVASIPYWTTARDGDEDTRGHLALDESRLEQATEAWVPVTTADGPGILMWKNCD